MAKSKNGKSGESKFLNPIWLRRRAAELGLTVRHTPFGSMIIDHNNHGNPIEAITREVWQQVEDHFAAKGKPVTDYESPVTRELDPEQMSVEAQADLVEAQMSIRGGAVQMAGAVVKLKGLMMRPNALLNPDKIESAFAELETLLRDGRAQLSRVRNAS